MKTEEYGFAKQHISKDEKILWKAKAKKKLRFGFVDIAALAVSALGLVVCVKGALMEETPAVIAFFVRLWRQNRLHRRVNKFHCILAAVSFAVIIGFVLYHKLTILRSEYVITTKKVIVKNGRKVTVLDKRYLPYIEVEEFSDGCGTIAFWEYESGNRRSYICELAGIEDVATVEKLIYELEEQ